jgi:hypothetical protein
MGLEGLQLLLDFGIDLRQLLGVKVVGGLPPQEAQDADLLTGAEGAGQRTAGYQLG